MTNAGCELSRVVSQEEINAYTKATIELNEKAAKYIIARQIDTIRDAWDDICEEAALTGIERNLFDQRTGLRQAQDTSPKSQCKNL